MEKAPDISENSNLHSESLLNYADITILETEKRTNSVLNLRDHYIAYLIETRAKPETSSDNFSVPQLSLSWRRYSEFEQLQHYLVDQYPYLIIPPLPERKQTYVWNPSNQPDMDDPDFIDRRRAGLENFLHRVATHPVLCKDKIFLDFLMKETKWNASLKPTGYIHLAESKLKELAIPIRTIRLNDPFDEILDYSKHLQTCADGILNMKAKTTEKLYTVDKLHANLGKLFSEWSGIEKSMGDEFQKIGHFIDGISQSTENILQDEDQIADQFKEYLFFGGSLEEMYNNRIALCLHISRLKEMAAAKVEERNRLAQGKSTIVDRLFGGTQTKEVRDDKVRQLNQQLSTDEDKIREAEGILGEFNSLALADFKRFEKQKDLDLQQTLSSYVTQQIEIAKKGLSIWMNIKRCVENIQ